MNAVDIAFLRAQGQQIYAHDNSIVINTVIMCYNCRKDKNTKRTCKDCINKRIDGIIKFGGRRDFDILRTRKYLKKNGKYYSGTGREIVDPVFIACAELFENIYEE